MGECYNCKRKIGFFESSQEYNVPGEMLPVNFCMDCHKITEQQKRLAEKLEKERNKHCALCKKKFKFMEKKNRITIDEDNSALLCNDCLIKYNDEQNDRLKIAKENPGNWIGGISPFLLNNEVKYSDEVANLDEDSKNFGKQIANDLYKSMAKPLTNKKRDKIKKEIMQINARIEEDPTVALNYIERAGLNFELAEAKIAVIDYAKYEELGNLEKYKKYLEEAFEDYNLVLENIPDNIISLKMRGHIFGCFGMFKESKEDYKLANFYKENSDLIEENPDLFEKDEENLDFDLETIIEHHIGSLKSITFSKEDYPSISINNLISDYKKYTDSLEEEFNKLKDNITKPNNLKKFLNFNLKEFDKFLSNSLLRELTRNGLIKVNIDLLNEISEDYSEHKDICDSMISKIEKLYDKY